MSDLPGQAGEYLRLRRALGHKLDDAHRLLPRFVAYLDTIGAETVTVEPALAWARRRDADTASESSGPAALDRTGPPPGLNLTMGAWLLSELVGRGRAKDLVLTGRWVGAAKAFALGLVDCVCDDPHGAAGRIVADLDRRGTDAGVKTVIAAGGLLARPRAERPVNRSAWALVTGASRQSALGHERLRRLEAGGLADAPARRRRRARLRVGAGRRDDPAQAAAAADRAPGRVAVTVDGDPVAHGELDEAASPAAAWLAKRCIPPRALPAGRRECPDPSPAPGLDPLSSLTIMDPYELTGWTT
jgi:enoyl-CoA hydratase/carnithine racemase